MRFIKSTATKALHLGEWRVAADFDVICRCDIGVDKVTRSGEFQANDELVVTADFKDVRDAGIEEQYPGARGRTMHLEVIEADSIKAWLNKGNAFGLGPSARARHSDICGCCLVRCWAMRVSTRSLFCKSVRFVS